MIGPFEVKTHLWPNEVLGVAHALFEHCRMTPEAQCVPVLMAPSISERTAERCQEFGVGWVDLAGNCHIQFGNVLVHVEGKKGEKTPTRGTVALERREESKKPKDAYNPVYCLRNYPGGVAVIAGEVLARLPTAYSRRAQSDDEEQLMRREAYEFMSDLLDRLP